MLQAPRDYTVESVHRAIRVMHALEDHPDGRSLGDISKDSGMSKPTVFRLLSTLALEDLVEQDQETRKYRLGVGLVSLGQRAEDALQPVALAKPLMAGLVKSYGVVAYLNVATKEHVLTIEREPHLAGVQFLRAGVTIPFHACASGLLFLAFGDKFTSQRVLGGPLPKLASGTISDAASLQAAIEDARVRGYAWDRDTIEEGVRSVAVPVFDHHHQIMATIGLTATSAALSEDQWQRLALDSRRSAEEISRRLGYRRSASERGDHARAQP